MSTSKNPIPFASRISRLGGTLLLAFLPPVIFGAYARLPIAFELMWVVLVPWALLYGDPRRRASAAWFAVAAWLSWIALYPQVAKFGWFVPLVMAGVMFVSWLPFPFLLRAIRRSGRLPLTLALPLAWVPTEWSRATFTVAHFDLYGLGYSHVPLAPLVQVADVLGVYGISFLVAAVNGLVADAILAARDARGAGTAFPRRRIAVLAAGVAGVAVLFTAYGFVRLAGARELPGPRVALVQPNVEHSRQNAIGVHLTQLLMTRDAVPAGGADLIVWPENAILDNIRREGVYLDDLASLGAEKGAYMLVGAMGKPPERPGGTTNTAFLLDPGGEIRGEYAKQMLFPWSEYIPGDALLERWAPPIWRGQRDLARRAWGFLATGVHGRSMTLLELPWQGGTLPFAVLICVENTYPPIPAEAARLGARFFVNITSESLVAGPIQEQLLRISMMRAIENRIAYVRCGNSGISGFIDPEGRLRGLLRGARGGTIADAGTLIDRVALSPGKLTLYARSHDAFALGCIVVALALAVRGALRRRAVALALVLAVGLAVSCSGIPEPGGDPAGAAAALERGRALAAQGRFDGAVRALAAACAAPGPCAEALPLLHDAYARRGNAEAAAAFFDRLVSARPELAGPARVAQAYFLERALKLREAEAAYADGLSRSPSAEAWAALGNLRNRMDDRDGALAAFASAIDLAPGDPRYRYLAARTLWLRGDRDEARTRLEALVAADPGQGAAWAVLARLRAGAGDDLGAEVACRQALRADPANVEARLLMIRRALRRGAAAEARAWLADIRRLEESRGRGPGRARED